VGLEQFKALYPSSFRPGSLRPHTQVAASSLDSKVFKLLLNVGRAPAAGGVVVGGGGGGGGVEGGAAGSEKVEAFSLQVTDIKALLRLY
jgi:hypothetical protein